MDINEFDRIEDQDINEQMKNSYIAYSMSVIVSRALPDVRDGLKPVHRRILYAMNKLGVYPNKPYMKSARITGETMGKYHPHGDSAIYDAMVRMAQDFSMRYMLVDGHGNFGSIDGDGAAAQRYTEAKLSKISMHMLTDIEKDTVDFIPNYTGEFDEPVVLPSRIPNLLINGSTGIAVGMATNIPPHNISEVIDAIVRIIENKTNFDRETEIDELLEIVKGPDFPTAANILGTNGIKMAYKTGKGKVVVRANAVIENNGTRNVIIVDEIPYQVNKARLLEKIEELVRNKKIDGISDLRDESDRKGMRIVIELKRDANPNLVLNNLYKYTQMQETYGINMIALINDEPKLFNLKEVLEEYLKHQKDVETRRVKFDLAKAERRAHILEGLSKALKYIDDIITLIKSSKDGAEASQNLINTYDFTEEQAAAIVDMRLRALTNLESGKIENELKELSLLIDDLKSLLNDDKRLFAIIKNDLIDIKDKFGDERRTKIVFDSSELLIEDLIDDEPSVITMTDLDYIKRIPLSTYKSQNRGGKGIIGMQTRQEDIVSKVFVTNTHSDILFFTNTGRVFRKRTFEIPEVGRTAKGTPIINLLNLESDENIVATLPINVNNIKDDNSFIIVTKNGMVKRSFVKLYAKIRNSGLRATRVLEDDEIIEVLMSNGEDYVFMVTSLGMGIKFRLDSLRPLSRSTVGVRSFILKEGDFVVGATLANDDDDLLLISSKGYGKRTSVKEFRLQSRRGKGTRAFKVAENKGNLIGVELVSPKDELMLMSSEGNLIRTRISEIGFKGRNASGVKLINLLEGDIVKSFAKISEEFIEDETDTDVDIDIDIDDVDIDDEE